MNRPLREPSAGVRAAPPTVTVGGRPARLLDASEIQALPPFGPPAEPEGQTVTVEAVEEHGRFVTVQELAPHLMGMIRGARLALYGAAGTALALLLTGNRDWSDLGWAILIGALAGFLGRTEEAVTMDTPRTTSVTRKQV